MSPYGGDIFTEQLRGDIFIEQQQASHRGLDRAGRPRLPSPLHEIRDLLRASAAATLERGQRASTAPGVAPPDRACRPARLRLRVGGGAPLSGRVFALLRPRGLPR